MWCAARGCGWSSGRGSAAWEGLTGRGTGGGFGVEGAGAGASGDLSSASVGDQGRGVYSSFLSCWFSDMMVYDGDDGSRFLSFYFSALHFSCPVFIQFFM